MLQVYVTRDHGKIVKAEVAREGYHPNAENRNNWPIFDRAKEVAAALGPEYIATDAGQWTSPRYDVIKLPKVGDKVSGEFNGDSYPHGEIVSISKSLKLITTSDGTKFYRVRETGSWRSQRTWFMTPGHVSKLNPSF
jgi:hypothetical protein